MVLGNADDADKRRVTQIILKKNKNLRYSACSASSAFPFQCV